MENEKKYYCHICKIDLTSAVKTLGVDSWGFSYAITSRKKFNQ